MKLTLCLFVFAAIFLVATQGIDTTDKVPAVHNAEVEISKVAIGAPAINATAPAVVSPNVGTIKPTPSGSTSDKSVRRKRSPRRYGGGGRRRYGGGRWRGFYSGIRRGAKFFNRFRG